MPILRPLKCGDLVLGLAVERLAGDAHDAGIDPLQAGDHHQQRRLARAGRADDAGRLAARHLQADALQHMHQRGAFTQRQRHVVQCNDGFCHEESALYWDEGLRVVSHIWVAVDGFQTRARRFCWRQACLLLARLRGDCRALSHRRPRRQPDGRIWAQSGRSLSRKAAGRAQSQGSRRRGDQRRRVRRHVERRPVAARLVGSRRHRTGHPGTRRQRHAARHHPRHHREEPRCDAGAAAGSGTSPCSSPACAPRPISAPTTRRSSIRSSRALPKNTALRSIPFFLDGVAAEPGLLQQDGMHPSAKGVDIMVERILPVVESLIAANPDNS